MSYVLIGFLIGAFLCWLIYTRSNYYQSSIPASSQPSTVTKDKWEPGKDLPWELQIMCDQVERFSLVQIVEACEMKIIHPELVVDVSEDNEVGYVAGPISIDRYGFPAVGTTAYCMICNTHYTGAPHIHSNIETELQKEWSSDDSNT